MPTEHSSPTVVMRARSCAEMIASAAQLLKHDSLRLDAAALLEPNIAHLDGHDSGRAGVLRQDRLEHLRADRLAAPSNIEGKLTSQRANALDTRALPLRPRVLAPRITAAAHATVSGVVNIRRMRILVTGASGVLGRVTAPLLGERGHQLATPLSSQLDLFDAEQVREAVHDVHAVLHLATRIPTPNRRNLPGAWDVNDRLRADATRLLVDGALSAKTELIVVPTAAFVYPPGPADESTPLADLPEFLRSALEAEAQLRRFTDAGRRGVALRFGSLYGPEAASAVPTDRYNVHLHTHDAGRALVAALSCPGGIYNVCDDTDPVSHDRFTEATGWRPRQTP